MNPKGCRNAARQVVTTGMIHNVIFLISRLSVINKSRWIKLPLRYLMPSLYRSHTSNVRRD